MHPMQTIACPDSNRSFYTASEGPRAKSRFDATCKRGAAGPKIAWRLIGMYESVALMGHRRRCGRSDSKKRVVNRSMRDQPNLLKQPHSINEDQRLIVCASGRSRVKQLNGRTTDNQSSDGTHRAASSDAASSDAASSDAASSAGGRSVKPPAFSTPSPLRHSARPACRARRRRVSDLEVVLCKAWRA